MSIQKVAAQSIDDRSIPVPHITTIRPVEATNPRFRGSLGYNSWTLCIGAGVSTGVVPTWCELARRVVNDVFKRSYSVAEFKDFVSETGWSLDSWIQSAANHHRFQSGSLAQFHAILKNLIYKDLLERAEMAGVGKELEKALNSPRNISRSPVKRICHFFEDQYGNTTLMAMVRWLLDASKKNKLPYAIISFNAEPLLHTVFELFQRREYYNLSLKSHSHPKYLFTRITTPRPSQKNHDRVKIPIYHCHGSLIPHDTGDDIVPSQPVNEIVFLEEDYLRVATNTATWPETLFMFHAKISQLFFVGLSMSDPNIRRWLGITEAFAAGNRLEDSQRRDHYWLTKKPESPLDLVLTEGLAHLGTRPAWIDDWSDLEVGLRNLTAV